MALKDLVTRSERTQERPAAESATQSAAPSAPEARSAPPAQSKAPTPAPRSGAATTFLDASTVFEGVIESRESLRLDGRVKGEIRCDHSVVVGESAVIEAAIRADAVAVVGEVRGDIHANRKITLGATARVVGDLSTPGIVIEEGASLEGRIQIGPKAAAPEQQPAKQAAQAAERAERRPSEPKKPAAAAQAPAPPPGA